MLPGSARKVKGRSVEELSRASYPTICSRMCPQSSAERPTGPILSRLHESAMQPWRLTRLNVGLNPDAPTAEAGNTIEPPVSVPIPKPMSPATVAETVPLEEPKLVRPSFQGLSALLVLPPANSPSDVLAMRTAPASPSLSITAAFRVGTRSRKIPEPHVVRMPSVSSRSLTPYGIPWRMLRLRPALSSASARSADSSAWAWAIVTIVESLPPWSVRGSLGRSKGGTSSSSARSR